MEARMNASVEKFLSRDKPECLRECTFYWTMYEAEDLSAVIGMLRDKKRGYATKVWRQHSLDYQPIIQWEVCKCGVKDMYLMCTALDVTFTLDTRCAEYLWPDMLEFGQHHMDESYEVAGPFLGPLYSAG